MKKLLVLYSLLLLFGGVIYGQSFMAEEDIEIPPFDCHSIEIEELEPPTCPEDAEIVNFLDNCGVAKLGIVFHVVQDPFGEQNLQDIPEHHFFLETVVERLNRSFMNIQPIDPSYQYLQSQPGVPIGSNLLIGDYSFYEDQTYLNAAVDSPPLDDIGVQFEVINTHFHQHSSLYNYGPGVSSGTIYGQLVDQFITGTSFENDGYFHAFLCNGFGESTGGVGAGRYMAMRDFNSLYQTLVEEGCNGPGGGCLLAAYKILRHELGHCLSLGHPFEGDDSCEDTPPVGPQGLANNIMDYNGNSNAMTACQRDRIYESISSRVCNGTLELLDNDDEPELVVMSGNGCRLLHDDNFCETATLVVEGVNFLADYTWSYYRMNLDGNFELIETTNTDMSFEQFFYLNNDQGLVYFTVDIVNECTGEVISLTSEEIQTPQIYLNEEYDNVICESESVNLEILEILGFPQGFDIEWEINGEALDNDNQMALSISSDDNLLVAGLNIITVNAISSFQEYDALPEAAAPCVPHCTKQESFYVYVNKPTVEAEFAGDCISDGILTIQPTYLDIDLTLEEINDYFPLWNTLAHFFSPNNAASGIDPPTIDGYNFQESQGHVVSIEVIGPSGDVVYEDTENTQVVYQLELSDNTVNVNHINPAHTIDNLTEIGTYQITVTVDSCTSDIFMFEIDDVLAIEATITPSDSLFCAGNIYTLYGSTSVETANYTWELPDGTSIANQTEISATEVGEYVLTVVADGCSSSTSFALEYTSVDPVSCDDDDCSTEDTYDETICLCVNTPTVPPNCDDNDCNTADSYDAVNCECLNTPIAPPNCDDGDCNTADSYDEENCTCVNTIITPPDCNDDDCNTADSYDALTCSCINDPILLPYCDDNNGDTEDSYDPLTCECIHELIIQAIIQPCGDVNLITLYPFNPTYTYEWVGIAPTGLPITDDDNEVEVLGGDVTVTVNDINGNSTILYLTLPSAANIDSFTETNPTIVTGTSSTWDQPFYNIKGTLTIQNGATLTLDNTTLSFEDNQEDDAGIIVEPGGKLIVNNSTLTNGGYCNQQQTWEGILAKGNNTPHPNTLTTDLINDPIEHAYVKLFNSRIENAKRGVKCGYLTVGPPAVIASLGGIVHVYDTDFINCGIGIDIYKFNHPSTINKIEYSSFISNNDNPFLLNPMLGNTYNAGIVIHANVRYPIHGNKFENNADPTSENKFIGAFVSDASTIFGKANNGSYGNEFNNLYKGIEYYSGPSVKSRINIVENTFNNTEQAITLTGGLLPVISKNTINLPDLPANTAGSKVYGIYTDGTQAFKIFDNDFFHTGSISNDVYAMYINASSGNEDYESTILRNRFHNDYERGISFEQQNQLIKLDCNEFLGNNQQDLFVSGYLADQGICNQFFPELARRNLFGATPIYHLDMTALTEDFPAYITDYASYNFKYAGHSDGNFTPDLNTSDPNSDLTQSVMIDGLDNETYHIVTVEDCTYQEELPDTYCIDTYPKVKSAIDGVDIAEQVNDIKDEISQATDPKDIRTLNTKLLHTRVEAEQYDGAKADLEEEGTDMSIKVLVATHVKEEEYEQAQTRLESLPLDKDENVAFYDLYSTIIDGVLAPSGAGKQPHEQEAYLRAEAEPIPTNQVNHYAQAVMAHHYLEVFPKAFKEDPTAEIEDIGHNKAFYVFPNPASNRISIVPLNDLSLNNHYVVLTDFMGNRLGINELEDSTTIPIEKLKAGIYFCELYQSDGTLIGTQKLVKF